MIHPTALGAVRPGWMNGGSSAVGPASGASQLYG
ncbi:hypothetical protein CGMCC3_g15778 [Colletotrichum fructicola]|nr:uncharacterized protein CGMCC3_g15778 [Colletotrichum fructicola]KAE9568091.1 hypothetical protein CGMCC3_g15778 [Colletotrichum fructicola]